MTIKTGDLLLKSQPYAYVLKKEFRGSYCDYCFKKNDNLKKCTQCSCTYYCDKTCQKSAWKNHKNECLCLKHHYPDLEFVRLTARIIYKLKSKPNECEKFGDVSRRFQDLMSHLDDAANKDSDNLIMLTKSSVLTMIESFIPNKDCPPPHELSEIYGKATLNSFGITSDGIVIGVGLYLGASILDHSCQPNANISFNGVTLLLTAVEDIPQLDPSNVFISYVDGLASTKERQEKLKRIYFFDCTCVKCQDVENDLIKNSILCPNADCTHPTVIKNGSFICLNCGEVKFEKDKLSQVEKLSEKCQKSLDEMDELEKFNGFEEIYEIAESCIKESEKTFHLFNVLYVKILEKVCESSRILSKWETAIKYGQQLIVSFRHHYGKFHADLAHELSHLGLDYYNCLNFVDAQLTFNEALNVISVTHSKHHQRYLDCQRNLMMCQTGLQLQGLVNNARM